MKKTLIFVISFAVVASLTTLSVASEMDKESVINEEIGEEKESVEVEKESLEEETIKKSDSSEWGIAHSARAMIKGTEVDSQISGTVDLVQTGDGVQVVASLSNVSPAGNHGFHIHENGSCEDAGKAAGGHFNPAKTDHGLLPRDGHEKSHTGDMGNIMIDEKGSGSLVIFMPGLSLMEGDRNIDGKAVILHAKEDDFGQPTGNAGGRIGCGIITSNK